ncbi:hypothetical protein R6Q59_024713 [Mikania micrantha]
MAIVLATNGGSAAARRRRIAERGAERLALITGRIQTLSSSSSSSSSSPLLPCPSSDQLPPTDENTDAILNTESPGNDVVKDVRSVIDNSETITNNKIQTFPGTSTEHNPTISTLNKSKKPESETRLRKTFSPKQLRPAITASENIRIICSITVAVLVVLADAGFPIMRSDGIKNIILFRPLLLLLITNMTIVAAHFLLQNVKHRSAGETGFANHIGTVLDWGLFVKTGSSAMFMDCSVYSVVVICGMGFLQLFGC